jgi:hypothetical protein
MNAVERLWRALRRGDWPGAEKQLLEHVVIHWPHTGERFDRATDYVTAHRLDLQRTSVDVRRTITEGSNVGLLAVVTYEDETTWHLAATYELQAAHIAYGVEVWARDGGEPVPRFRG